MNNSEAHKYIRFLIVIFLLLLFALQAVKQVHNYHAAKGKAIANYLSHYHNIEIPPEQARYFDVNVTQWEISIDNLDVFGSWENGKGKRGAW